MWDASGMETLNWLFDVFWELLVHEEEKIMETNLKNGKEVKQSNISSYDIFRTKNPTKPEFVFCRA